MVLSLTFNVIDMVGIKLTEEFDCPSSTSAWTKAYLYSQILLKIEDENLTVCQKTDYKNKRLPTFLYLSL